jgi:serine protease Do
MGDPFEWFNGPPGPQNRRGEPDPREYSFPNLSAGSGFIVDPDGYILTNNHVVTGANEIRVILDDGREFDAEVVGEDPDTDVAILKIDDDDSFPYIEFGDSDTLQVGDWVMAVGNPFGNLAGTVTVGIVSATNREYLNLPGNTYYQNFIQTDAAINLGNSGGPLVDMYGRAVGINTAITATGSGIGFATPIQLAEFVYDNFIEYGEVVRGWIGVTIQNLDADMAGALDLEDNRGALLSEVHEGNPADEGGLQEFDVLLEIEGQPVVSVQTASRLIAALPVGEPAEFLILRDGEEMTVEITPERRDIDEFLGLEDTDDEEDSETPDKPGKNAEYLGIDVIELTDDDIAYFGLPEDATGVLVDYVAPDGPAFEKGLMEGMVIVSINREPVENLDDYDALMEEAYEEFLDDGSSVVIRYLTYSPNSGWVRQFMAVPFE